MGCTGSKTAASPRALANLAKCKETFEMQAQMAKGAIDEAKFAEFIAKFAGFFAPTFDLAVNPEVPGPKVTGNLELAMQTIAPIWLGFKLTRIENQSFAIKAENVIVVSQVYDNHLTDASGVEIPGTANKGMEVKQTVTYDADGKIKAWVQEYDAKKVQASRNMAACRETFEIQIKMAMGKVDESMIAEFSAKFAGFFAPTFDMIVNPKTSGPKVMGGTFVEAVEVTSPIWIGFKNTNIDNKSFVAKRDGTIEVTQVYHQHLTDASGVEVEGTALKNQVVQTVTYTHGKISSWVQEFDKSAIQAARQTHIMALCKATCEAQAQLAMGEVNQEMLADFGKKFASSFTQTFEMAMNPQIPGPQVTGTFSEVMDVVGPTWLGFKNTKIESPALSLKGDNVVFVSQVLHQQLMDTSGEEVPGAHHILEMQTTYTYDANGKILKLVQEFDVAKVEASRKVAEKVRELTESAPKVEVVVEGKTPEPVACGFFKICM
jgi:peroxiredoxin